VCCATTAICLWILWVLPSWGPQVIPSGPHCGTCPHRELGQRFIEPDGSGDSGVLLVGDSPWMEEMAAGRNFAGAAGFTYNRMLSLVGIERSNVMTSNTIWCKPLRLKWMDFPERFRDAEAAITHCRPNLDGLIERAQPKVIVPMGNVALRRICGVSGIESHAGYVMATRTESLPFQLFIQPSSNGGSKS